MAHGDMDPCVQPHVTGIRGLRDPVHPCDKGLKVKVVAFLVLLWVTSTSRHREEPLFLVAALGDVVLVTWMGSRSTGLQTPVGVTCPRSSSPRHLVEGDRCQIVNLRHPVVRQV